MTGISASGAQAGADGASRAPATNPDQWVDAYADLLFRYAATRLWRRDDAEDAVQETLLAALTANREFRGDSAERTWLIGILRHKIVDAIRLAARQANAGDPSRDDLDGMFGQDGHWLNRPRSWQGDPAALSENAEFWQQVRVCFAALPERQAQVFALRTFDGMDAEDICKQTGVSPTNLWVLLHRARTRLRACLESTWFAAEPRP
jgi:RNA polymerase sigma-70 factor (ECF subfamily)